MSSNRRYDAKRDQSELAIAEALRTAGYRVYRTLPVDLLITHPTFPRGWARVMEAKTLTKTGKRRKRKDQPEQDAFIAETGTPVVGTPEQALHAASGEYICPGCHLRQQSGVKTEGGF